VLFDLHPDCEVRLDHNPFPDDVIDAIRTEIAQRRQNGLPTPQITLPLTDAARLAMANPDNAVAAIVQDNGAVHTEAAHLLFTPIITALAAQFPHALQGTPEEQRSEMQAVAQRFSGDVATHAASHPQRRQGLAVASDMFSKGLGDLSEFINDFQLSSGHVLFYTLLAMRSKLDSTQPPQERLRLHEEFTHSTLTALTYFVREGAGWGVGANKPCDTRNVEELAQLVEVFDLAKLPPSPALMLELGLPTAQECLRTILADNPHLALNPQDPEEAENLATQAQAALLPAFQSSMVTKIPGASPEICATFLSDKIFPAWDTFKDMATPAGTPETEADSDSDSDTHTHIDTHIDTHTNPAAED
jgi:hypothetical protein